MSKHKQSSGLAPPKLLNPVAKYAGKFNKARIHRDKSKYSRKGKHKYREPLPMALYAAKSHSVPLAKAAVFPHSCNPSHLQNQF